MSLFKDIFGTADAEDVFKNLPDSNFWYEYNVTEYKPDNKPVKIEVLTDGKNIFLQCGQRYKLSKEGARALAKKLNELAGE